MGPFKYSVVAVASILNFFMPVSMAVNSNCDYYQEVMLGQEYYISNQQHPSNYGASTSCRWTVHSEPGTRIVITCDVQLPSSSSCSGDRLSISLSGNENFSDAEMYCGFGSFSLISNANSLSVGLFSTSNTAGGRFMCRVAGILVESSECDCGWKNDGKKTNNNTRIVGGLKVGVNEYPSMAGLVDVPKREVYCGSTIISYRYVVSAAHCVINRQASDIGVLVGDHDTSTGADTPTAALYRVSTYEMHPNYNSTTQANDIAILQTSKPIAFSIYVGPVCLPFRYPNFNFNGQVVTALGWGSLCFSCPHSDVLHKVNLPVIPNTECAAEHRNPVTDAQVCTYAPGKDGCQSDSGGPLPWMDTSTRRLQLIGVISYGIGCATDIPGVNTRVTSYLSWIISTTSDASYCFK